MMSITDTMRTTAAQIALEQVGKGFKMFSAGPLLFDCSGLVKYAWSAAGIDLPHNSVLQAQVMDNLYVTLVPYAEPNIVKLKFGDIIFYTDDMGVPFGHCGIYTDVEHPGSWDRIVQATDPQRGVEHLRFAQYVSPIAIGWMGHR